jgi:hypothetical protein
MSQMVIFQRAEESKFNFFIYMTFFRQEMGGVPEQGADIHTRQHRHRNTGEHTVVTFHDMNSDSRMFSNVVFDDKISSSIQVLDFSGNNLQILPREVFSRHGLLNLQKLKLSYCNIGESTTVSIHK